MHFNIKSILDNNGFGNKDDYKNIYVHLYDSLKKAIITKALPDGVKLPPSRVLARDLEISRSTVLKAYDLLVLEKYVSSKVGSGYYIGTSKNKKIQYNLNVQFEKGNYPKISKRGMAFKKGLQIINAKSDTGVAFRPGLPPLDIFPVNQWKKITNDYWRTVKSSQLSYSETGGLKVLRDNISNYLKLYRNIECHSDQIIITTGSLHSLSLIADALIDKNDDVVIENPTYPLAYNLFKSLKSTIHCTNIDEEGIVLKHMESQKPKLVYTTPSNQYPTGIKMSFNRRIELLNWASKKNTFVIEDDYDHEFSNWENPISSIFSLDKQQRTIYLGTFNKLLHPSIRMGYMIVPYYLLDTVIGLYKQSSRFVPPASQNILSTFIEKDYLNKHLRKVIEATFERKAFFLKHFNDDFENEITINTKNTGLHFIGKIDSKINDTEISNHFADNGIITHAYSKYFIDGSKKNGLVMGYSSVNTKVIRETINKMRKEYVRFLSKS
ncbi:PLP-dependent aminotransferase family protein [Algibacter sp. 2305UL17-15]|uniref:MocR-like pyridoxine biosynthesis transcription factor PdxR n=1 Tax=Algibacter sp. 2305UL17-15 TaxID=3231268 RepID=UPI003457CBA9